MSEDNETGIKAGSHADWRYQVHRAVSQPFGTTHGTMRHQSGIRH